jgi:ubiquinone/menaquinone biosynthesis C-methylase UbiE
MDKEPFEIQASSVDGQEILEGTLTCRSGHSYPILRGVPRLLRPDLLTSAVQQIQESFGHKWLRIPNFGYDETSRRMYVNWYLERYGFGNLDGLRNFLADKRTILDAGTGLGRDARLYGENAPGQVFALDISDSIDQAFRHAGHLPNVHLLQADLTALPFRESFFDYIACDQVIHHTPNTEASFRYLTRYLSPGSQIAFYVYKIKTPIREFCDDFLRGYYTEASEEECYAFSRAMTLLGKSLSDLKTQFDVPEDLPLLGIKAGRYDIQRFLYWNVFKCYWNYDLDFETNVMTNFDWYRPKYAHRHTPEEVHQWCRSAGLEIINFNVIESGISVRAQKPKD